MYRFFILVNFCMTGSIFRRRFFRRFTIICICFSFESQLWNKKESSTHFLYFWMTWSLEDGSLYADTQRALKSRWPPSDHTCTDFTISSSCIWIRQFLPSCIIHENFDRAVLYTKIFPGGNFIWKIFSPGGNFLNQMVNHCLPVIFNRHIDR